ncbi:MAG: hypothetical protein HKN09_00555, partial [Saprospiraceae bacterium]|nr:hypothetical protein [Saprospiraceae bacterium]
MDYILRQYFKIRQKRIQKVALKPLPFQQAILRSILDFNKNCLYGQSYDFINLKSYQTFQSKVPLVQYEDIVDHVNDMMQGVPSVLCSNKVNWFAKSSGTSNDRSKFIPVTIDYLKHGHLKCAWDAASIIYHEDPSAKLFKDRSLIMGGSL